jgi:hypothetical protein
MEHRALAFSSLKHCRKIVVLLDLGNEGTMFEMSVIIISTRCGRKVMRLIFF